MHGALIIKGISSVESSLTTQCCMNYFGLFFQPSEQGDTPYHPRETTNMRTQTVASYFRVRFYSLLARASKCAKLGSVVCHIAEMCLR